ncbi:hypothetical protein GCM10027168_28150 [Streptomyces capparidis]
MSATAERRPRGRARARSTTFVAGLSGRNTTSGRAGAATEPGTTATPHPAATMPTMVCICTARCPGRGANPASRHSAVIRSWRPGPASRGKSTNGSPASARSSPTSRVPSHSRSS